MFDWLSAISLNERECKNFQVFCSVFRERVKPHGMLAEMPCCIHVAVNPLFLKNLFDKGIPDETI